MKRCICTSLLLFVLFNVNAYGQGEKLWSFGIQDEIIDVFRPQVAVAPNGEFGIALEVLVQSDLGGNPNWQIMVQRFTATGTPIGQTHFFTGESCSTFDIWTFDYMENPELLFEPGGALVVLMQHTGRFSIGSDDVGSSEATLAAIDANGQVIDLHNSGACIQHKLIFPGAGEQDRPRMDVTPRGEFLVSLDGFFQDAPLRNVAIRIYDNNLNELLSEGIPHDDPNSQQAYHLWSDIATNGSLILSTWQQCPIIDNQGNENDCDIGIQFIGVNADGSLAAVGGNQRVNDDPQTPGIYNFRPAADMNANGNSIVAWMDQRDGFQGEIYGQRYNNAGQPMGSNFKISAGEGIVRDRPEVAILDNGRFMAVWYDSSAVGFNARGRRFNASGNPEGPPFVLAQAGFESGLPALATDGSDFLYTWLGERNDSFAVFSNTLGRVVSNEPDPSELPESITTLSNFPNPFITSTTLTYTLHSTGHLDLSVYDMLGRRVLHPVHSTHPAGTHHLNLSGQDLAPGVYIIEATIDGVPNARHTLIRAE